jgi:hypothetical protein
MAIVLKRLFRRHLLGIDFWIVHDVVVLTSMDLLARIVTQYIPDEGGKIIVLLAELGHGFQVQLILGASLEENNLLRV